MTILLRLHGIYQQDDRDKRKALMKARLEKDYSFMIRTKNPGGGNITPQQWLIMDDITNKWSNPTLRITTRECFQFHGIGKKNLKQLVKTGKSRKIEISGVPPHYEVFHKNDHHHFFVCEECLTMSVLDGCIGNFNKILPAGCRIKSHEVVIYGECKDCVN